MDRRQAENKLSHDQMLSESIVYLDVSEVDSHHMGYARQPPESASNVFEVVRRIRVETVRVG